jgi:hypothetical protein
VQEGTSHRAIAGTSFFSLSPSLLLNKVFGLAPQIFQEVPNELMIPQEVSSVGFSVIVAYIKFSLKRIPLLQEFRFAFVVAANQGKDFGKDLSGKTDFFFPTVPFSIERMFARFKEFPKTGRIFIRPVFQSLKDNRGFIRSKNPFKFRVIFYVIGTIILFINIIKVTHLLLLLKLIRSHKQVFPLTKRITMLSIYSTS